MAVVHPSYLGFFADVKIYDPKFPGEVIHFVHPQFPFISGVTAVVQGEDSQLSTITLGIDAPFTEGKKILNSRTFAVGNAVEVLIGYPGGPVSKPFYGWLHDGGVGLELTAEGLTGTIRVNAISRAGFFSTVYSGNKPLDAYDKAIRACGFEPDIRPKAKDAIKLLSGKTFVGIMQNQALLDEVNFLAHLKCTREARTKAKPLMVVQAGTEIYTKPVKRRFVMRGQFDSETNSYPLISYGPELQASQFAFPWAEAREIHTANIDAEGNMLVVKQMVSQSSVKSGKEETQGGDPEDASTPAPGEDGGQVNSDRKPAKKEFGSYWPIGGGDQDRKLVQTQLRNMQDQAGHGSAWNATVVSLGIPDIQPFELCRLEGTGSLFDGTYLIKNVTHSLSVGNYQTTLTVMCRTLDSAAGVHDPPATGTV